VRCWPGKRCSKGLKKRGIITMNDEGNIGIYYFGCKIVGTLLSFCSRFSGEEIFAKHISFLN